MALGTNFLYQIIVFHSSFLLIGRFYRTQCSYWTKGRAPFKLLVFIPAPPSPYKLEWDGCMKKNLYQQRFFVLGAPHISILVTDSVKMTLGGGWVMAVGTNFLYQNIVFHSSFLLIGRFYRTQCSYWTKGRAPFKLLVFIPAPPSPYKLEWDGCMKKNLYQQRFFVLGAPHISILVTDSVKMTLGGGWVMAVGTNFLYQNIVFHSSFLLIGRFYRTQCRYWTKGRAPFKPSCFYSSPPPSPYKLEWDGCMNL